MLRLPIWMIALSLTGCFLGNTKDEDEETEDNDEVAWEDDSADNGWGSGSGGTTSGGGSGTTGGGSSTGGSTGDGGTETGGTETGGTETDGETGDDVDESPGDSAGGSDPDGSGETSGDESGSGTTSDGGSGSGTTSGGSTDGDDMECDMAVASTSPSDGDTDTFYRTNIEVVFYGSDPDASITVSTASGTPVDGTTVVTGDTLLFTPDEPLTPATDYIAIVDYCAGRPEIEFRTSDVGLPLDVPLSDLVGRTYQLDTDSGDFVEPAGFALPSLFEDDILVTGDLLGVAAASSGELELLGALSEKDSSEQDFCEPTTEIPPTADFSGSPTFFIGPETTLIAMDGGDVTLKNFQISGTFSPDAEKIENIRYGYTLDNRDVPPTLLADLGMEEPDELCVLFTTFGVECTPCEDGELFCMDYLVEGMTAEATGDTLIPLDECDPEWCDDGCE